VQKFDRYSVYGRIFGNRFFIASVSMLLIVIALNWLVDRLNIELERAEVVQFQLRLAELRSAVTLMESSQIAKGTLEELDKYVGSNPMDWVDGEVAHYLGERRLENDRSLAGNWIYDPNLQVIAYLPKSVTSEELLAENKDGKTDSEYQGVNSQQWLRFKVVGLSSKDSTASRDQKLIGLELKSIDHPAMR
jgi:hypothetical protein